MLCVCTLGDGQTPVFDWFRSKQSAAVEPPPLTVSDAPEQRSTSKFGSLEEMLLGVFGQTVSKIDVNPQTALSCTIVFACRKVIAETLSELPLKLYRKRADGGRDLADDHPLSALLTDAPNDWTPSSEFKLAMTARWCLTGNSYAFVSRNRDEVIEEIVQIEDGKTTVKCDPMTGEPIYTVTDRSGNQKQYSRQAILHVRGIGNQLVGDSPIHHGREAIALAMAMERHAAGLFGRGAKPAGVLKHPKTFRNEDLAKRLRAQFEEQYSGTENAGKTIMLEDGVEWEQTALSSVDAQFLELRKFAVQEVCRLWRVPLHMVGDLDRTTHSNAEELGEQFLSMCLLPILRMWQSAIAITCLTREERKTLYPEFLVDDLARANLSARMTAFSQAVASGILNPNECRALDNRTPYTGGETFTRPVNSAPVQLHLVPPADNKQPAGAGA